MTVNIPKTRSVLFDIDGTLVCTGGAGQKAFAKACRSAFAIQNGAEHLNFAGRTDTAIVRDFFKNHDIDPSPENFQKFFESYVGWLGQTLPEQQGRVLPGIHRWIDELKGLPSPLVLGLLTGNIRIGAKTKLSHFSLWDHFELGAFGDDHEDRNQVAAVAQDRLTKHFNEPVQGDQIVVVGDTPLDIACARAIGAKALAVATGTFSAAQLQEHEPDWLAEDLEQISVRDIV